MAGETEMTKVKVVLIGAEGTGKTQLARRLRGTDEFHPEHTSTIGANFYSNELGDESMKLEIWDTAGAERYRSLLPMYTRNADVIVYVVDPKKRSWNQTAQFLECA